MLTIFIDFDFYPLATPGFNYTRNYTDIIWKGGRSKSWKTIGAYKPCQYVSYQKNILNLVLKKRLDFCKDFLKSDNCLMLWISIVTQLSANLLFAWIQFSFYNEQMNRCVFRYKSMKSVKIKTTRWMKWAFHWFLLIDQYNWYQSNQIYLFFFIIDYCVTNMKWTILV